jgi:hypothetical protein
VIHGPHRCHLTSDAIQWPPPLTAASHDRRAHVEDMLTEHGTRHGLRIARKHVGWYLASSGRPAKPSSDGAGGCAPARMPARCWAGLRSFYDQGQEMAA